MTQNIRQRIVNSPLFKYNWIVEKLQTVYVATPCSYLFGQVSTRQGIFVQVTRST